MEFTKTHGLGNDFIIVNGIKQDVEGIEKYARKICDRHFGIGADGILLVLPSRMADVRMKIINSDGSEAMMCGNGIRCFAHYAYTRGIVSKTVIDVETPAGVKRAEILSTGIETMVKVDMGEYSMLKGDIPMLGSSEEEAIDFTISTGDNEFKAIAVSMGNPHCVIFVENVDEVPLEHIGPVIENHPLFPNRTNVEFVEVLDEDHLKMRVWERGAGITMACGTGACACAVAALKKGLGKRQTKVFLPGGELFIDIDDKKRVFMTGPVREVFNGRVDLYKL
jgi:diaminopimelate epimerase